MFIECFSVILLSSDFAFSPLRLFSIWFYLFSTKFGLVTYKRLLYKPMEALLFWLNSIDVIPD